MSIRTRRRRLSDNSWSGLVAQGKAQVVLPTTDTGYKSYGAGRLLLPASTNYCTNPSFELDTNSDGTADGITQGVSITGAPVYSRVAGRNGGYAQRLQYAGTAGDASGDKVWWVRFQLTGVGSFASGDTAVASFYSKVALSGVASQVVLPGYQANGTTGTGTANPALATSSEWTRRTTALACGADTSRVALEIWFVSIGEGDTLDVAIDDALIEKSSVATPYFDGTYPGCAWTGTVNASTSTRTVSALEYSGYVTLSSAGVTAAGTNIAYFRNASGTYYGPGVVTPAEKSAGWQTIAATLWPDPVALFNTCAVGDLVVPLGDDSRAYLKVA